MKDLQIWEIKYTILREIKAGKIITKTYLQDKVR
jgi:hypothetical protein